MTERPKIHPAILNAERKLEAARKRTEEIAAMRDNGDGMLEEMEELLESLAHFSEDELSPGEFQRATACIEELTEICDSLSKVTQSPLRVSAIEAQHLRQEIQEWVYNATHNIGGNEYYEMQQMLRKITNTVPQYRDALKKSAQIFSQTEEWRKLRALFDTDETMSDSEAAAELFSEASVLDYDALALHFGMILPLAETITKEMRAAGRETISLREFFGITNPDTGEYILSIYEQCIIRGHEEQEETRDLLERVAAKSVEIIEYPIDKINSRVWSLLEEDTAGQIELAVEKFGTKKPISVLYSIDFDSLGDGVKITKRLDSFDKRAYIAIGALWNAGNTVISSTQIHTAMGSDKRPSADQLKRINDSLTKLAGARIYVDNSQEAAEYKYDRFVYDGQLLPMERMTAIKRGQITEMAINLFREPPLITFAKKRKQITTIPLKLLQSPINKTEGNLMIDDYLLERISRARKDGKKKYQRILYETLYKRANITTTKQKSRAPKTIERYLEHYKVCGYIKRYTEETDGVTVYF